MQPNSPSNSTGASPEEKASLLSRLVFDWVRPFLPKLKDPNLDFADLLQLRGIDRPDANLKIVEDAIESSSSWPKMLRGLLPVLVWANRQIVGLVVLWTLIHLIAIAISPIALKFFIAVLQDDLEVRKLLFFAAVVAIAAILSQLTIHHVFFQVLRISLRVKAVLPLLIYKKVGNLSLAAAARWPTGKVVNIIANDVNRIGWAFNMLFGVVVQPLGVIVSISLLYYLIGVAGLVTAGSLLLMMGVAVLLTRIQARVRNRVVAITDRRVTTISELLGVMQLIKLFAWEEPLKQKVTKLRHEEERQIGIATLLDGANNLLLGASPVLAAAILVVYLRITDSSISLAELLPAMGVIVGLRFSLGNIPGVIQALVDASISARRIDQLLQEQERVQPELLSLDETAAVLKAENLTTKWSNNDVASSEVSLTVYRGETIGIIGAVGAGKSALLSSLAGELEIVAGTIKCASSYQIVGQNPWIFGDTIRSNIILGREFDSVWFDTVVRACVLDLDIAKLPQGDLTVIGERGVTLSGGQKARVALARAIYARADLYLLDDPISALDPEVAAAVMQRVVFGLLRNAATILVSHRHSYLSQCSKIFEVVDRKLLHTSSDRQADQTEILPGMYADHYEPEENAVEASTKPSSDTEVVVSSAQQIESEERNFGAVSGATARRYVGKFTAGGWGALLLMLFLVREIAGVGMDSWVALWSTGVTWASQYLTVALVVLGGVAVTFHVLRFVLTIRRGLKISSQYHCELLSAVLAAPLSFFWSNPLGRIANRFSRDIAALDDTVSRMISDCLTCITQSLVIIGFLLFVNPWLVLVILPAALLYLHGQALYRPASRECQRLDSVSRSPILTAFTDVMSGLSQVRDKATQTWFLERLHIDVSNNAKAFYSQFICNRWVGMWIEMIGALIVIAAFVSAALVGFQGELALLGLSLTLTLGLSGGMNWAVRSFSMLEAGLTSAERIEFYSATPPEEEFTYSNQPPENWPLKGRVSFKNVTLAYRPELPAVVQNFSLDVAPGERIGIVGRTGSGKSTIMLGLFRAIEQRSGQILIDGVDISTIPRATLRRALGIITQDTALLNGTIRYNLDPFGTLADSEIWNALHLVHLASFVRSLPLALETSVGEGGANFSQGQRQLICLARVVLKRPKIVVMDEPTSSVDPATDLLVQAALHKAFPGATVITIAHRLETLGDYDRVVRID